MPSAAARAPQPATNGPGARADQSWRTTSTVRPPSSDSPSSPAASSRAPPGAPPSVPSQAHPPRRRSPPPPPSCFVVGCGPAAWPGGQRCAAPASGPAASPMPVETTSLRLLGGSVGRAHCPRGARRTLGHQAMACYTGGMTAEERAERRRHLWSGGLLTRETHAHLEREFWSPATSEQRLAAVWEMAVQHWHQERPDGPALRLDRSVGGVRRYGG